MDHVQTVRTARASLVSLFAYARVGILTAAAICAVAPSLAPASVFDPLTNKNTEIIPLPNGAVDLALRTEIFKRAKVSIDFTTYTQTNGEEAGRAITQSIALALRRGATGRFLYEGMVSRPFDIFGQTEGILARSGQSEILNISPLAKILKGLTPTDFFHAKIAIIDAGTPDEIIFVGGRNHEDFAMHWLDFGMIVRPIDPGLPYLGTYLKWAFNDYWETGKHLQKTVVGKPFKCSNRDLKPSKRPQPSQALSPPEKQEFENLMWILSKPATLADEALPGVFIPQKVHVATNNFFKQLFTGKHGKSIEARSTTIKSDVISSVVDFAHGADRIDIATMLVKFPKDLYALVEHMLRDRKEVHIYTNGKEAQPIPGGWGYKYSVMELDRLVTLAHETGGKLFIHAFMPELFPRRQNKTKAFSHLKQVLAYFPDGTVRAVVGSDNFNETSWLKNEEIAIFVDDPRFGNYMANRLDFYSRFYYRDMPLDEVAEDAAKVNCFQRFGLIFMRHFF